MHNSLRRKRYALHTQSGKAIMIILVAVSAMAVGAITFNLFSDGTDDSQQSSAQGSSIAERTELAALQENLQTSLALPKNFKTVPDFQLLDVNAEPITEQMFEDQWSLVFFGFTHCPDVCPITLQTMKQVVADLQEQQQTIPQIVFVSIDPARDTPEVMKNYIGYFDEDFAGVTGDVKAIHDLSSSLGIVASFTANETDPDNYGVDHTASLLLIDPQRRVRAKITPPHVADKIVSDYLAIIATPS